MNALSWIIGALIVLIGGFYALNTYIYDEKQGDIDMTDDGMVEIFPVEHASFVLRWGNTYFYNDPVGEENFAGRPAPSAILLTDIHGDHLSTTTLASIGGDAPIIAPQEVVNRLPEDMKARARVLNNGDTMDFEGVTITATPAYNLPDADNADRHTKGRGNGYILEKNDYRVYIAGDTAATPEMRALENIAIAFLPMNLPYTMGVEEAAEAVLAFKPRHVYPYHFRTPEGYSDVARFQELVTSQSSTTVTIATWYPSDLNAPKYEE